MSGATLLVSIMAGIELGVIVLLAEMLRGIKKELIKDLKDNYPFISNPPREICHRSLKGEAGYCRSWADPRCGCGFCAIHCLESCDGKCMPEAARALIEEAMGLEAVDRYKNGFSYEKRGSKEKRVLRLRSGK